jgi:hypothetical protein
MEPSPAGSYDTFPQAEDDAKYLEQYMAHLLPSSSGTSIPAYARSIAYPTQGPKPGLLGGNAFLSSSSQEAPADPLQAALWQPGPHPFPWRGSDTLLDSTAARALRGGFLAAPTSSTELFKKPAPTADDTQLGREDSAAMDGLSDPNDSQPPSKRASTSLQEKNRRAQKRFREKQKASAAHIAVAVMANFRAQRTSEAAAASCSPCG